MPKFYIETINSLSDRLQGPIDPKTGWPTVHPSLITEAATSSEAKAFFEQKFPKNVLAIIDL